MERPGFPWDIVCHKPHAWPSGQSILNYISDVDTAEYSATLFRHFLEYLWKNTDAERINIIAYSAGTKLAAQALHQIGLMEKGCEEGPTQEASDFITSSGKLDFINVSGLEGTKEESGHGYFRSSPWVSSDVLANLGLDMTPGERGLVRWNNQIFWSFPEDYIERLRLALEQRIFEKALMQKYLAAT